VAPAAVSSLSSRELSSVSPCPSAPTRCFRKPAFILRRTRILATRYFCWPLPIALSTGFLAATSRRGWRLIDPWRPGTWCHGHVHGRHWAGGNMGSWSRGWARVVPHGSRCARHASILARRQTSPAAIGFRKQSCPAAGGSRLAVPINTLTMHLPPT
jgi:hypothetical protein